MNQANQSLHIGARGLAIEEKYEQGPGGGFAKKAYKCPAGKWTIGWGHVIVSGGDYMLTTEIGEATADQLLQNDNIAAENGVKGCVEVELNQNEFDALVSLFFNDGAGALAGSTLVKKLNAGDRRGAADEFPNWCHIHDPVTHELVELAGLKERRMEERALFLTPISVAQQ